MILNAIFNLAYYVINFILSIFPVSTGYPTAAFTAMTQLGGYYNSLNTILPVSTMSQALVILLIAEALIFGFKNFKWIISHIPFIGGRG